MATTHGVNSGCTPTGLPAALTIDPPPSFADPVIPSYPDLSICYPAFEKKALIFTDPMMLDNYRLLFDEKALPYDPAYFRHPAYQNMPYQIAVPLQSVIQDSSQIEVLKLYLLQCAGGFHPGMIDLNHPIHATLGTICKQFLSSCENWPLKNKIEHCEKAVVEIVHGTVGDYLKADLSLAARLPKFELLEIAVRNHLFQGMLQQQNRQIAEVFSLNKKFPNDLGEREIALFNFATKNYFFNIPIPIISSLLVNPDLLCSLIETSAQEASDNLPLDTAIASYEKLIRSKLKSLQLENPSQVSADFQWNLRGILARKLVSKQAQAFKAQFQKTGTISQEEMKIATDKIEKFNSMDGTFNLSNNLGVQLLGETFELPYPNPVPFAQVRVRIGNEKKRKLEDLEDEVAPKPLCGGLLSFLSRDPAVVKKARQSEIEALVAKKLDTIDWAEKLWSEFLKPSAPLEELPSHGPHLVKDVASTDSPSDLIDLGPELPTTPLKAESPVQPPQLSSDRVVDLTSVISEPAAIQPTDWNIPLISYVDVAFAELFKSESNLNTWQALPEVVQKDVLRHCFHFQSCQGKAEEYAIRRFKTIPELEKQFDALNKKRLPAVERGLSKEFVTQGENLLKLYYTRGNSLSAFNFVQKFKTLPKEPLFFQYVHEMAKAAGVQIAAWDHDFARNNWDQVGMIPLSVQALERCLHTTATSTTISVAPAVTEIKVKCKVPFGHTLTICGQGGDLDWVRGKALVKIDEETYVYRMKDVMGKVEYKILLDDVQWENGANHTLEANKSQEIVPSLVLPKAPPVVVDFKGSSGSKLYIRGTGPGMSWVEGVELKSVGGKFIFESNIDSDFEFKVLIDDNQWSQGENFKAETGKTLEIAPRF